MNKHYDLMVIGAGPAGLAAAYKASQLGVKKIVLIEREPFLGGILGQCIHAGFGLKEFKKELTGPEYAQIFIDRVRAQNIDIKLDTMALAIDSQRQAVLSSKKEGIYKVEAKAVILGLGCRERTRGAIGIPGTRPAGIYTAGVVQRMINIEGYLPGKKAVVLGSGDIGLIMARRLTLEGCKVEGVFEIMPFSTGLNRNIAQCLEDFDIPLYLNTTVSRIYGRRRLKAVEVSGKGMKSPKTIDCDTLLLSVGLIPENELSRSGGIDIDEASGGPVVDQNFSTSREGFFSCGNSLFVNDLADDVTQDAYTAAQSAVDYIRGGPPKKALWGIKKGKGVLQVVPQKVIKGKDVVFKIRVKEPYQKAQISLRGTNLVRVKKYLSPGELVFFRVKAQDLEKCNLDHMQHLILDIHKK